MAELEASVTRSVGWTLLGMRRKFYVAMAVLMITMIFIGFWPSYYGPLTRGATQAPPILHIHGFIYISWMFLLVAQTYLAATGRVKQHIAVGNFGIYLGSAVFVMGLIVSFVAPVMTFNAGTRSLDEAAGFLLIPLGDMALFGPLFFSAVAYRKKSELHKRLMTLSTIAIAFAAIFRMQALGLPLSYGIALWFALPVFCLIYDLKTKGKIHPVYWLGIAGMILAILRIPFSASETWLSISRPIIQALA